MKCVCVQRKAYSDGVNIMPSWAACYSYCSGGLSDTASRHSRLLGRLAKCLYSSSHSGKHTQPTPTSLKLMRISNKEARTERRLLVCIALRSLCVFDIA